MSPTDTELEPLLTEALRAKAAQVPESAAPFDPTVEMTLTLDDDARRPRFALLAAAAAVVVIAVGVFIAFGQDGDQVSQQPAAPPDPTPVARIEVHALPELSFQAKEFTTIPGLNEIDYLNFGGSHDLVFADPSFADFRLTTWPDGRNAGAVNLEAGRDYTIYCTIPGHRDAGMTAVIHVTDEAPSTTTIPGTSPTPSSDTSTTTAPSTTTTTAPATGSTTTLPTPATPSTPE